MKVRVIGLALVMAAGAFGWACSTDNPARPSMSFVAPIAQAPANNIAYNFTQQPITLQIVNAVRTGGAPVTYNVEVSTSTAFSSLAFSREGIAEGSDGTTSVQLPTLVGNTTYLWRWRAVVDGIAGEPSTVQSFFLRPNVVIQAPTPVTPASGSAVFAARPTFTVTNASRTGPAGTIFYDFQVSASAAFGTLIASATVQETANQTSWAPTSDLPEGALFWRVRAKDPSSDVTGPFTGSVSFDRRFGIDISKVVVSYGPQSMITWPETAKLRAAYFQPDDTETLCTEYDDPGWPEAPFFGGPATVYANQWVFVPVNGVWYAGAAAWMRAWPQFCKRDYDQEFFNDNFGGRFPFGGMILHTGDILGVMISTPARAWPDMKTIDQRSNILLITWPPGR